MRAAVFFAIGFFGLGMATSAAQTVTACTGTIDFLPTTISKSGVWCLKKNLRVVRDTGPGIEIMADNVTIDLGGFTIWGSSRKGAAETGISAASRNNITIRNGTIVGFGTGVFLTRNGRRGSGHVVENIRIKSSYGYGIFVSGDGMILRNNQVLNTWMNGATDSGVMFGIYAQGKGLLISDNSVYGVMGDHAYGIRIEPKSQAVVKHNIISNIHAATHACGICVEPGSPALIIENEVLNSATKVEYSSGIAGGGNSLCIRNEVIGFDKPFHACDQSSSTSQ